MLYIRAVLPCRRQFSTVLASLARTANVAHSNRLQPSRLPIANECTKTAIYAAMPHRWYAAQPAENVDAEKRIYYGTLASRMKIVKLFSLTTSLVGLAAQPVLLEQGMKIGGTGMAVFLCTIAGLFTFVTPLLLHFITKKYVCELHYNPKTDEYTATTISLLLMKIKTKFRTSDVVVPEVPGMFTSFLVNKRPLFVDPALFDDTEHYVRLMGYDKPIDFKLDLSTDRKNKKREQH